MKRILAVFIACALSATLRAQPPDFTPQTPLIGALLHDDAAEAARLLERGADPNEGQFVGMPPMLLAVIRQDLDLVRLMAAKGADLSARDRSGSTALMWAAFNETGDAAIVTELLARGADPLAVNRAGETALVWALRRGETPVVAALRRAGADETAAMKNAVERATVLLQRSSAQFSRVSGCYSCHHTSLPQMAIGVARSRGLPVDETIAHAQTDVTVAMMKSVAHEALENRDRIPDPPISVSVGLLGLAADGYPRDETTDAMTRVVAAWQGADGAFRPLPSMRPPIEGNAFTATALSLRALQYYGTNVDRRIADASAWLRASTPRTTDERAMQVLGLAWAKAPSDDLRAPVDALLAMQRPDGGWAQLSTLEADAYATGQALVALNAAGVEISSDAYRRGVAFLLRTQFPDGSWLVRTRAFPVQPLRDTGFPHGRHQWISAAGTSWATMALALALPSASRLRIRLTVSGETPR